METRRDRTVVLLGSAGRALPLLLVGLLSAFGLLHVGQACAQTPEFEIKLATMAPENSSMMQIFNEMNAELMKETGGKVGFKMFAGFVLGDEEDVLRKLRIGLVHAAAFTSTALTDVNPDLRAFLVPFLFGNYEEVDYILGKMDSRLKQGFAERGFEVLGWPELGFLYFLSKMPIAGMDDIRGRKIWGKSNAPMLQAIINKIGVSTVAISAPDVLMALQTNLLEVVYNSPYYALVTQWYTQVGFITDAPVSYVSGALVLDKKVMAKMPQPLQDTLRRVVSKHMTRLIERTRKDNADALEIIAKRGVKKVSPDLPQLEAFRKLSDEAMAELGPKAFPMATYNQIKADLVEYRKNHPQK